MIVACSAGFYGKNCSEECSSNCDVTKACDKITGACNGDVNQGGQGWFVMIVCIVKSFNLGMGVYSLFCLFVKMKFFECPDLYFR